MSPLVYSFLFFVVLFLKVVSFLFFSLLGHQIFGGGNDSGYYHDYAKGLDVVATSLWPVMLRLLEDVGVYSRSGVTFFLFFLSVVIIPFMVAKLSVVKESPVRNRVFWGVSLLVGSYPALFYYSLDIYRDVFMVFVFLCGLFVLREISVARLNFYKLFLYVLAIVIVCFLFKIRPYLGSAFGMSLALSTFYSFRRYPLLLSFLILLLGLNVLYAFGMFAPLLTYRAGFEVVSGGSNFGISFSSVTFFVPDLLKSTLFQLFGLSFINIPAVVVFVLESLPFAVALFYLIVNREFCNKFVDYILIFFVFYSVVWLLGNDNLGTAVRLRMFNYLSVYIACMIVYQNKFNFYRN